MTKMPTLPMIPLHRAARRTSRFTAVAALACAATASQAAEPIASLDVERYMGAWRQVAHYPNRFQQHCVRDTTATYRPIGVDAIEVTNRCITADGKVDAIVGLARPRGATIQAGRLTPASLQVSFLPAWLRWLPLGWGSYDVISLSADERVAIVSEPSKNYLWVLARDQALSEERWQAVTNFLGQSGFDLGRIVRDPVDR